MREVFENQTLFDEALAAHEGFVRLSPEDRRLAYHLAAGTIKYKRRLDFIAQEISREANTIGAKANNFHIARDIIKIKSLVEKIREQTQNVE